MVEFADRVGRIDLDTANTGGRADVDEATKELHARRVEAVLLRPAGGTFGATSDGNRGRRRLPDGIDWWCCEGDGVRLSTERGLCHRIGTTKKSTAVFEAKTAEKAKVTKLVKATATKTKTRVAVNVGNITGRRR